MITNTVGAKAVATGGVGAGLAYISGSVEFLPLVYTGLFASISSYFYDWVHRDPRHIGLKEFSELVKYMFYGTSIMFIVFYLGKNHGSEYINLPTSSWGFLSALCAGSAVSLVEWVKGMLNIIITKKVMK